MGLLCVAALTIGYLFLFPTIVWDISFTDLIDVAKGKYTGASIEAFLKKYNFVNQTSADYAKELITITIVYTIIFALMAFIILKQIKNKIKLSNSTDSKLLKLSKKAKIIIAIIVSVILIYILIIGIINSNTIHSWEETQNSKTNTYATTTI